MKKKKTKQLEVEYIYTPNPDALDRALRFLANNYWEHREEIKEKVINIDKKNK